MNWSELMDIEKLINQTKKGDTQSFSLLIDLVKEKAYRIAYCYLYDESSSMDAVYDAVEKAYRNLYQLREPKYFSTWFIRIVINECKGKLRKNQRLTVLTNEISETDSNPYSEDRMDLEVALQQLLPDERLLIQMKYFFGYTFNEIAEITEVPVGTVKTRLYKILRELKNHLELKEV